MPLTNRLVFNPTVWKFSAKYWYPLLTRTVRGDDVLFFNPGYEEDPPLGIPLSEADERYRYFIQLYHRVAAQVDLAGKDVLEVSCGHGGGASYITRTMKPASYTAVDLNKSGIDFCRKYHNVPGLRFQEGNADNLPFGDASFDAIINVEASHCYPSVEHFLSEVARMLRPGGHFLYIDARWDDRIPEWDAVLAGAPLRMVSQEDISLQSLRGMKNNTGVNQDLITRHVPSFLRGVARNGAGTQGSALYRALEDGRFVRRLYCFAKD